MRYEVCKGDYNIMGVGRNGTVTTFSVENKLGKECFLLLYSQGEEKPVRIPMQRAENQTSVYSVGLKNLPSEECAYLYEIGGKTLVDPYAKRIVGREVWGDIARNGKEIKCGINKRERFDWGNDRLPQLSKQDMIMYKLHVRGFSMLQKLPESEKGTFKGIERKLTYLKELGITTLEFMPVYEFEEMFAQDEFQKEVFPEDKINYWGYTRGNYFALKSSYLGEKNTPRKFKQLIQKLHQNDMECILEFYFDKKLNPHYILEVLHYWSTEYHVDGFHLICDAAMVELIAKDRRLSGRKLFFDWFSDEACQDSMRAMDLFSYNDGFLYAVRRFINQQGGSIQEFADHIKRQHKLQGFVNYLATNNGFCLYDSFAYTEKRNQENGEENQDGIQWNYSNNCGEEGPTKKRYVNQQRERRIKNALCALMFSQGVPLIWMGDENCNSQNGNNNAYCQDNETGWKNWDISKRNREVYSFLQRLIELRKKYPVLRNPFPMEMNDYKGIGYPDLSYHGESGWKLGPESHDKIIGMMYNNAYAVGNEKLKEDYIYIGYNFSAAEQRLALPDLPKGYHWFYALNTDAESITGEQRLEEEKTFSIQGYSVCVLIGRWEEPPKTTGKKTRTAKAKQKKVELEKQEAAMSSTEEAEIKQQEAEPENKDIKVESEEIKVEDKDKAENEEIKADDKDIEPENEEIKADDKDIKLENQEIKSEYEEIKAKNQENVTESKETELESEIAEAVDGTDN